MKREIKFRAFSTKDNEMYSDEVAKRLIYNEAIGDAIPEYFTLMQFTGLKDRNSKKEIYEGDIVKVKGMKRTGEYITSIVHKGQGFTLAVNKTYFIDDRCFIAILEVIGNIYENPELVS